MICSFSYQISPSGSLNGVALIFSLTCYSCKCDISHLHNFFCNLLINVFIHHKIVNFFSDFFKSLPGFSPKLCKFIFGNTLECKPFLCSKCFYFHIQIMAKCCEYLSVDLDVDFFRHFGWKLLSIAEISDFDAFVNIFVKLSKLLSLNFYFRVISVF